jgi:glutaredoxin-related protein
MSSFKSFFKKKHKYESQSDLKGMTPQEIVNINPKDIGTDIVNKPSDIPLDGVQKRAMFNLIAIKKQDKITPSEAGRQNAIKNFMVREGLTKDPKVDAVINTVQKSLVDANTSKMIDQLEMKDMRNRLNKLSDKPTVPYTEEELLFKRLNALGGKSKARRSIGRKFVTKKRKTRKTRKTRKYGKGRKTFRRK